MFLPVLGFFDTLGSVAKCNTPFSLPKNLFFGRLAEVKETQKTSNLHSSAYTDTVEGKLRSKANTLALQGFLALRIIDKGTMISYPFITTSSKFGSVKRGVIELTSDGKYVDKITECSISIDDNKAVCENLNTGEKFDIELKHPVSMNLFGFKQNFMNLIEKDFQQFIHKDEEYLKTAEIFLPDTAKKNIANGNLKLKNIVSEGVWAGLTYKEDLEELQSKINNLIEKGEYPKNLWNN